MKKDSKLYGVIGLGRFGFALAKSLAEAGREVLVIDSDEQKIREAAAFTDNAFIIGALTMESLREAGVQNCDVAVVCIGEKIDVSILTTLTVLRLGVPHVISKAISPEQGSVLEMLGAEVVYPERDMAVRVARRLTEPQVLEYISLSADVDMAELRLTDRIQAATVRDLELRARYGLNIIAIRKDGNLDTDVGPETQLHPEDALVVVGKKDNLRRFEKMLEG